MSGSWRDLLSKDVLDVLDVQRVDWNDLIALTPEEFTSVNLNHVEVFSALYPFASVAFTGSLTFSDIIDALKEQAGCEQDPELKEKMFKRLDDFFVWSQPPTPSPSPSSSSLLTVEILEPLEPQNSKEIEDATVSGASALKTAPDHAPDFVPNFPASFLSFIRSEKVDWDTLLTLTRSDLNETRLALEQVVETVVSFTNLGDIDGFDTLSQVIGVMGLESDPRLKQVQEHLARELATPSDSLSSPSSDDPSSTFSSISSSSNETQTPAPSQQQEKEKEKTEPVLDETEEKEEFFPLEPPVQVTSSPVVSPLISSVTVPVLDPIISDEHLETRETPQAHQDNDQDPQPDQTLLHDQVLDQTQEPEEEKDHQHGQVQEPEEEKDQAQAGDFEEPHVDQEPQPDSQSDSTPDLVLAPAPEEEKDHQHDQIQEPEEEKDQAQAEDLKAPSFDQEQEDSDQDPQPDQTQIDLQAPDQVPAPEGDKDQEPEGDKDQEPEEDKDQRQLGDLEEPHVDQEQNKGQQTEQFQPPAPDSQPDSVPGLFITPEPVPVSEPEPTVVVHGEPESADLSTVVVQEEPLIAPSTAKKNKRNKRNKKEPKMNPRSAPSLPPSSPPPPSSSSFRSVDPDQFADFCAKTRADFEQQSQLLNQVLAMLHHQNQFYPQLAQLTERQCVFEQTVSNQIIEATNQIALLVKEDRKREAQLSRIESSLAQVRNKMKTSAPPAAQPQSHSQQASPHFDAIKFQEQMQKAIQSSLLMAASAFGPITPIPSTSLSSSSSSFTSSPSSLLSTPTPSPDFTFIIPSTAKQTGSDDQDDDDQDDDDGQNGDDDDSSDEDDDDDVPQDLDVQDNKNDLSGDKETQQTNSILSAPQNESSYGPPAFDDDGDDLFQEEQEVFLQTTTSSSSSSPSSSSSSPPSASSFSFSSSSWSAADDQILDRRLIPKTYAEEPHQNSWGWSSSSATVQCHSYFELGLVSTHATENQFKKTFKLDRLLFDVKKCEVAFSSSDRKALSDFKGELDIFLSSIRDLQSIKHTSVVLRRLNVLHGYYEAFRLFLELKPDPSIRFEVPSGVGGSPKRVVLKKGDLCFEKEGAIVNPANSQLTNQGGLSEQIVKRGGKDIVDHCDTYLKTHQQLETGQAFTSRAGKLQCSHVIHTVGPYYNSSQALKCQQQLAESVRNCLLEAERHSIDTITMPWISSGIFGYPVKGCVEVTMRTIFEVLPFLKNVFVVQVSHIDANLLTTEMLPVAFQLIKNNGLVPHVEIPATVLSLASDEPTLLSDFVHLTCHPSTN